MTRSNEAPAQESLFDRLGGMVVVSGLVERFYERVLDDPELSPFFESTNVARLNRLLVQFIAQAMGGPAEYHGRDMKSAHESLAIQLVHFDRVASHLVAALTSLGVSSSMIDEVMALVAPLVEVAMSWRSRFLNLYRFMLTARFVDEAEAEFVSCRQAFFHVSGSGHEGAAVLELSLTEDDWLYCHYRDKALMLARGVPAEKFFDSLLCNARSYSAGRQMSGFMSDPARRLLNTGVPVGNHALHAVGVASVVKEDPSDPVVVCSMGDGTTQQGEVLEAIAEAVRSQLPVLFWIEDNGWSISTRTRGKTFYDLPGERPDRFYGLTIHRMNGRDVLACHGMIEAIVGQIRKGRGPAIIVFEVERLASHTNADDEWAYRNAGEIEAARQVGDPIQILGRQLLLGGVTPQELDQIAAEVRAEVRAAAESSTGVANPEPALVDKKLFPAAVTATASEYCGTSDAPRLTMLEAMREVLRHRLAADSRVTLFGEDIEDPKGDVFGLTRGLTRAFPGRVFNSPLSESTIVGVSIGRALAGARPVAFIQFADFLPHAFNQILSELGSMHWRTDGTWQCPVILMIACGAYRPGLGPFHSQTLESVIAHVPGVDVLMPSTAADCAGLLNAAFESGRPTLFFYPKALLNDRDRTTSSDVDRQIVPLGKARFVSRGDDLTVVTWGSTVVLCEKAASALGRAGVRVDLIDLRSIAPWDHKAVCDSVRRTRKLLVVHEDNSTCGFGAEVVAAVLEFVGAPVEARRVTRPDTYVPCNFSNQIEVLPSFKRVLNVAAELLNLELTWRSPLQGDCDLFTIEAQGTSPADDSVTVIQWKVEPGDTVSAGQHLAELEADKATFFLTAPADGVVVDVLVSNGQSARIGTPLLRLRSAFTNDLRRPPTREDLGTPMLRRRPNPVQARAPVVGHSPFHCRPVGLSVVHTAVGACRVTNYELAQRFPGKTPDDILKLTGIESRPRLAADESVLSLAVEAARQALEREGLSVCDLDAIICSTTTPVLASPSMACLVLHELDPEGAAKTVAAYDVNAACSGYLYALSAGYDFLQTRPHSHLLVLSAEAPSSMADPKDFDTAVLFGDAASATILYGATHPARPLAVLHRPVLSARGENGSALRVPALGRGYMAMNGRIVFREAVACMAEALTRTCAERGIGLEQLDLVVPHQANRRIIDALRARLGLPAERVFTNIRHHGNTSSSSIPLALAYLGRRWSVKTIGLCSFGAGFTYGAAILETSDTGVGAFDGSISD